MKVLTIGTDRKLFEERSAVQMRSIEYASKMEELHIIVFSTKEQNYKSISIGNLHIYPTNSGTLFNYIFDTFSLGKKIIPGNKFVLGDSVISAQDPFETGLVGYFLKMKFNFPFQIQIHTDLFSPYFKNSFINYIRVFIAKFLIPKASGIRVVSETIKDSIKRKFPRLNVNPEILPIFVDMEKIMNTPPKKDIMADFPQFKFIIFMASRLSEEKRIDIALDMMKNLLSEFPYIGLIIAGEGPQKSNLENKVKKLGLTKTVVFIGWQDDLISYYKTANIFLLTSEYEGYGMTLIEAGASGCPIVTTKVGIAGTSLFINGENSFVCPVGDTDCILESILQLFRDNEKRQLFKREMGDSIKKRAISKEEYIQKYVSLLEYLIQK